ncbi:hypothetical protein E1A91_A01G050300v1, partial [Gossypium mustelinum]
PYFAKITFLHNALLSIMIHHLHVPNRALFFINRLTTPAPPFSFGLQTCSQLTFAIFRLPSKLPHRKFLLILSNFLITDTGA